MRPLGNMSQLPPNDRQVELHASASWTARGNLTQRGFLSWHYGYRHKLGISNDLAIVVVGMVSCDEHTILQTEVVKGSAVKIQFVAVPSNEAPSLSDEIVRPQHS